MDYRQQLGDPMWLAKRNEILERDGYQCVVCGCEKGLQVHHKRYISGRMPWEYDNKDLTTLCSNCHSKFHDINEKRMFVSPNSIVMFRNLVTDYSFTPAEKIIYAAIASNAMYRGKGDGNDFFDFEVENVKVFSKRLKINRHTYYTSLHSLKDKGIIVENKVQIPKTLFERGYFKLEQKDGISGQLLIFYSYIKDKSKRYGGTIDTYKRQLAKEVNVTFVSINQYFAKLHKLGLIKRLDNGLLQIL